MPKPGLGFAQSASPPGKGEFSNDWKKVSVRFRETKRTKRTTKQAVDACRHGNIDMGSESVA
jgi:hypothetical protein